MIGATLFVEFCCGWINDWVSHPAANATPKDVTRKVAVRIGLRLFDNMFERLSFTIASLKGCGGTASGFGYLTENEGETFAAVDFMIDLVDSPAPKAVIHGEGGNFSGNMQKLPESDWRNSRIIEVLYIALFAIVSKN